MTRVANKTALAAADAMAGGPGRAHFSCDTYVNQHTLLCARLAAGTCADVATAVVRCVVTPYQACFCLLGVQSLSQLQLCQAVTFLPIILSTCWTAA